MICDVAVEWLIALIGNIVSIGVSIGSLAYWLGRKFTCVELRLKGIEGRITTLDSRVESFEKRIEVLERRFDRIEHRVESLERRVSNIEKILKEFDSRLSSLEKRFGELEYRADILCKRVDKLEIKVNDVDVRLRNLEFRFESFVNDVKRSLKIVIECVESCQHTMIDFMSMKGLFTDKERDFIIREIERIVSTRLHMLNPLKPEEAKFILEVLQELKTKNPREIDLSKLDRIMEIAERWLYEDADPDAAKLKMLVYMLKRILEAERGEL